MTGRWLQHLSICAVSMIGDGFKAAAGAQAREFRAFAVNPFAGLVVGIVATALTQSSSTVTSILVWRPAEVVLQIAVIHLIYNIFDPGPDQSSPLVKGMWTPNFLGKIDEEIAMKKRRFTQARIMGVLRQAESGLAVADLCRAHGISSAMFYKWRAK